MKDPNLLLGVLSVVWLITIALFSYIIKMKDKGEESTKASLNEIKSLISNMSLNVSKVTSDLDNNIYATRGLDKDVKIHNNLIQQLQLKVTSLTGQKIALEQRVTLLERKK